LPIIFIVYGVTSLSIGFNALLLITSAFMLCYDLNTAQWFCKKFFRMHRMDHHFIMLCDKSEASFKGKATKM